MTHQPRSRFLAAAGTALASTLVPRTTRAQTPTIVKLGATPSDDMTPIVYGQHAGIFQKHGLDVQINRMTSGAAGAQGLIGGAFDFAKASVTTILSAHEKGIPFSIVAEPVVNDPKNVYSAFVVLKESSIQGGKDLDGQLVGVPAIAAIGSIALNLWLERRGSNAKNLRFVEVPFPAAGAAVEAGRVVAAEISNPNLQVALERGKLRIIPGTFDAIANTYLEVAWCTTTDFSSKHPETVRAFVRAFGESVTYTATHHDETAPIMAEFTGIPLATIEHMARALAWPTVVPAHIQPVIDATLKFGAITRGFPASEIIDVNAR
jgi:NitT/TauT family transport system substrate-binding protein